MQYSVDTGLMAAAALGIVLLLNDNLTRDNEIHLKTFRRLSSPRPGTINSIHLYLDWGLRLIQFCTLPLGILALAGPVLHAVVRSDLLMPLGWMAGLFRLGLMAVIGLRIIVVHRQLFDSLAEEYNRPIPRRTELVYLIPLILYFFHPTLGTALILTLGALVLCGFCTGNPHKMCYDNPD